ncbi:MAG: amylo-alpha-1,6-glucosidase, partial [Acidimicrobiales bacterium]
MTGRGGAAAWTFADESPPVSASSLTLTEGTSFVICDAAGDIDGGSVDGVFVGDTRVCNRLVLTVDGRRVEPLAAARVSPFHAAMVGRTRLPALLVFREHWVGQGLRSDLRLRNPRSEPRRVTVGYSVGADLAGVSEVKEGRAGGEPALAWAGEGVLGLGPPGSRRSATVRPWPPALLDPGGTITWEVEVPARGEWACCLELAAVRGGDEVRPRYRCGAAPEHALPSARQARWRASLPRLDTDVRGLGEAVARAGDDLGALRIFDPEHPGEPVVAAGAPWFMTLFGRDSLLTSWMALVLDPSLALATVRTLARLQGTATDQASEEQPGRILHEVRLGASASFALGEGVLYYGSADATPLFVMLVAELRRWGVPLAELEPVLPAVDAALRWVAGPGDPDGDGYVEYRRATGRGLANQGWKDSWDAVSFADGRLAEAPVAVAEVQAYAYGAWTGGAELAEAVGDHALASERRLRAAGLRERFNRDFWLPEREAYAMALDREKRPVDAIASNVGHCLWAGIVDPDRAAAVGRLLVSPELWSGWGVRTLATSMARYDPLSYHNGSVWPHDTAICVAGLRRAGRVEEALRLASGLLDAAAAAGGQFPELFSGIGPDEAPVPVAYPASCRPQAWASAAPLLVLRALLGLEPDVPGGRLEIDPLLPPGGTRLRMDDVPLAGGTVGIEVDGDALAVLVIYHGVAVL